MSERPTPETDAVYPPEILDREYKEHGDSWGWGTLHKMRKTSRRLERERDEALALLASEKSTRNAIIAKGIEMERQLDEARELVTRLRQDLDDPPADVQERVLAKLRAAYANLNPTNDTGA